MLPAAWSCLTLGGVCSRQLFALLGPLPLSLVLLVIGRVKIGLRPCKSTPLYPLIYLKGLILGFDGHIHDTKIRPSLIY
jgi:hypothetical protein